MAGSREFKTMKPYISSGLNMQHLGLFMDKTFSGRLTEDKIKAIRDKWKGNLVVKGIVNPDDADLALKLGVDGLIVSNHGGRQLDSGESTIKPLTELATSKVSRPSESHCDMSLIRLHVSPWDQKENLLIHFASKSVCFSSL